MPVYNTGGYLKTAVESILSQSLKDFELILFDDGSTDGSSERCDEYGRNDSRVVVLHQNNGGICNARNAALRIAKGEYIAFQDSDDEWMSDKLEKQKRILDAYKSIDIVCCKTLCKKLDGTEFISLNNRDEGIIPKGIGPYGISTQTLMVRKNVFD